MSVQNSIKAIPLATLNAAALGVAYQPVNGPDGLEEACIFIRINNDSTTAVTLSYDGVTDHEYLGVGEILELPVQSLKQPSNYSCSFKKGTIIYALGAAGVGFITISGYYQPKGV